ncbi:type II toxin-antitoxin system CcdA family antitoxin [Acidiphilium multivorum]|nr:type II toxin-antitoxin system CcdA family antitoxin [Acidiphilium multivorum]
MLGQIMLCAGYAYDICAYPAHLLLEEQRMSMPQPSDRTVASSRRATNVTLPAALLQDARSLGINLSQACEQGVATAVAAARRQRWLDENRAAFQAWNEHVESHGLPLAAYRQF